MSQLGFYINSGVCSGCKACELACKDKHSFDVGPRARRVREVCFGGWTQDATTGSWTPNKVGSFSISFSCGHCETPMCYGVCPTGAITKRDDDGVVVIDQEKCTGCKACIEACPYGAPQFVESLNVVQKCDMCIDLIEQGEQPACVAICPQRALEVGDIEELRAKYGDVQDIVPLPDSSETNPSIVITPHRNASTDSASLHMMSLYTNDLE